MPRTFEKNDGRPSTINDPQVQNATPPQMAEISPSSLVPQLRSDDGDDDDDYDSAGDPPPQLQEQQEPQGQANVIPPPRPSAVRREAAATAEEQLSDYEPDLDGLHTNGHDDDDDDCDDYEVDSDKTGTSQMGSRECSKYDPDFSSENG